jgi:transposase InsO family protein
VPFFDARDVRIDRVLTDRGTEFCGVHNRHEYELYLAVENIDHSRTKTRSAVESPQTNGICERFHKTLLEDFYRVAFRKRLYASLDELQADLDTGMASDNEVKTHQGRWCFGKTPMQTFLDSVALAREKQQPGRAARTAGPTA